MTTCQLCGRESDNSAFCSTCEPKASRLADVDSQASQLMASIDSDGDGRLLLRVAPRGSRYEHPGYWVWELRPAVAASLLVQLRALLEGKQ
jgi:hypothetical protein